MSGQRATIRYGLPYGTLQNLGKMLGVTLMTALIMAALILVGLAYALQGSR